MRISVFKRQTVAMAKNDIKRHVRLFKHKLRQCNSEVKEHLVQSYGTSILRYLGTPLLGAQLIKED